jgi:hypothetical protein
MTRIPDYVEMVLASTRDQFVVACPFPFLVGDSPLIRPAGPQRTMMLSPVNVAQAAAPETPPGPATAVVLAVRKVQDAFPNMITVGRTPNNDLVLSDIQISKFHAFFRVTDGSKYELVDVGSRNGTWLRGRPVGKEGQAVTLGDQVRFARLEFLFFDAGACWDAVRRLQRHGSR